MMIDEIEPDDVLIDKQPKCGEAVWRCVWVRNGRVKITTKTERLKTSDTRSMVYNAETWDSGRWRFGDGRGVDCEI